jgi:predicted RND superfamily exporter protein
MDYYEDAYGFARVQSLILTAKEGKTLASKEAFAEMEELEKWFVSVEYDHVGAQYSGKVKYENLCYKVVDTADETPCFHLTPLDCFKQGMQSVPGIENNTKFTPSYTSRPDFTDASSFNFGTDFTKKFIDDKCKEWYNLQTPLKMIFGGTTYEGEGDTALVSGIGGMRNVFATRSAKKLAERGVLTTEWLDSGSVELDILGCPLDVTEADCSCVDSFAITSVVTYGCSPNGASQPATCCDGFMEPFTKHPCAKYLFQTNPSAAAIGALVIEACGLPAIDMGVSQCNLQPDGTTKYQQPYTGYETKTADECQVIMSDAELTAACNDFDNSYESATKCCAMVYDASKQKCHCRFLDTTPRKDYFDTFGEYFETYAAKCLRENELYDECPTVPPPPSPPPPGEGYSCISNMEPFLNALKEALADPTDLAKGLEMCGLAQGYYGNYCMCDATVIATVAGGVALNPALAYATDDAINVQVANSCAGGGVAVRAHSCTSAEKTKHDTCAADYDTYRDNCLVVLGKMNLGMTPTSAEVLTCCNSANAMAANACPCVHVDDGYGVDRSVASSSDIRLDFILNTPVSGCVAALGGLGWTANTYTCQSPPSPPPSPPPGDPTYTLPSSTRHAVDESEAESILEGWEKAWLDGIENATKDFEHIEVSWYASRSLEDVISDASKSAYGFIAIGYALVVVFCFFFFIRGISAQSGKPPGPVPAILATIVCILSTAASLGFAAFYVEAGLKFNAITLQVVPFLALGLGMNDYFVFAKYVKICHGESPKGSSAQYIIRRAYRKAGASITASSATNFAAFCLGAITPIPAVRAFSIQVAMTVVCNYIAAVVIFPCLLLFDLQRHVDANPDAVGELEHSSKKAGESSSTDGFSCVRCLGAFASIVFRMMCVALSAGFFAFCAAGIDKVKLGLDLEDVVPSSSYIYDYALNTRNYFATYQVSLVSSGVDFSTTTENQALLEHDFVTAPNVNVEYGSVNYLRYLADETTGKVSGGEVCSEDTLWLNDYINLSDKSLERCAAINEDASLSASEKKLKCFRTCMNAEPQMAYAPTTHNPTVTDASKTYRCSYNATNNHCVCPWRQVYKPALYNQNMQTFLDGGERGQISQSLMITNSTPTSVGYTTVSDVRAIFYVEDVFSLEDKLHHMREARKIAESSKLATEDGATVFPFDYALYALNEQYLNIERNTLRGLGISVAIAFVVMYPFVTSLWLDVILTFVIAVVQIELYGLIHWIDLKLNAVTMVNLIMTVGISIEFVIHEARAFAEAKGTRPQRAAQALSEMGPAIFASAFTTFLAVLPLVGADYEYFQKYFFSMYAMILFVGLFNALVTLPALLSFIGPPELVEDAVRDSEGKLDKEMV